MAQPEQRQYSFKTLVGNWNEEWSDLRFDLQKPRLLSNTEQQWRSTYSVTLGQQLDTDLIVRNDLASIKQEQAIAKERLAGTCIACATTQSSSQIPSRARPQTNVGRTFPGHQPEAILQPTWNHWETSTMDSFKPPKLQVPKHAPPPFSTSQKNE